jgi:NAD-dependent dihydropyrimidine dehydrogenase PreA subunit
MATRKIIRIDEELCNGCGDCVVGCAEGALQIIDGKAKLIREDYCDGFGDCVGTCPTGALTIEEREVPDYDPEAARAHVARTRGSQGLDAFDEAAGRHAPTPGSGCPGSRMRVLPNAGDGVSPSSPNPSSVEGAPAFSTLQGPVGPRDSSSRQDQQPGGDPGTIQPGQLGQWPIMLHLVPPQAPFFKDKELCVLSSCSPAAMPDAQWRFVRGRGLVMACPKLDRTDGYLEKLTAILREPTIPRAVVVRMEVPCCGGLSALTVRAAEASGRGDLEVVEATVSLRGELLAQKVIWTAA